jgi:hypothetical protein
MMNTMIPKETRQASPKRKKTPKLVGRAFHKRTVTQVKNIPGGQAQWLNYSGGTNQKDHSLRPDHVKS